MLLNFFIVFQISIDGVFGPMLFKNNILKQRLTLSIKRLTFSQQAQSMETVGPLTAVINIKQCFNIALTLMI